MIRAISLAVTVTWAKAVKSFEEVVVRQLNHAALDHGPRLHRRGSRGTVGLHQRAPNNND